MENIRLQQLEVRNDCRCNSLSIKKITNTYKTQHFKIFTVVTGLWTSYSIESNNKQNQYGMKYRVK